MTNSVDACAAAIAGVRERYEIVRSGTLLVGHVVTDKSGRAYESGPIERCQAWIDREKARACLEATLPVSKEIIETMADEIGAYREFDNENFMGANDLDRAAATDSFTAAIHAITKQEEG